MFLSVGLLTIDCCYLSYIVNVFVLHNKLFNITTHDQIIVVYTFYLIENNGYGRKHNIKLLMDNKLSAQQYNFYSMGNNN